MVAIGQWQVATIFANLVFGKSLGITAGVLARRIGQDTWLAMVIAFALGFAVMAAMVWLARRFEGESPAEYILRLLGPIVGRLVLLLFSLFFFGVFITSAITVELHISDFLMTETPLIVFVVLYSLLALYGAYHGIEVAARLSVIGVIMGVALAVSMIFGVLDLFDYNRLLPLFERGFGRVVVESSIPGTDVASATLAALFLLPMVNGSGQWLKYSWIGLALGALQTLPWPIFEIAAMGAEVTSQYLVACMQLGRTAQLSIYLHRYELVMMVLFSFGVLTQSMVSLYLACEIARTTLGLLKRRMLFYAVALLATLGPHYWIVFDRDRFSLFLGEWWPPFVLPVAVVIPLLLAVASALTKAAAKMKDSGP